MSGLGPTPLDDDRLFLREDLFSGGPNGLAGVAKLRIYPGGSTTPRHVFDSMLATNISAVDAERVSYFLRSNGSVSLYAFGRAIQAFRVQCVLIDGDVRDAAADALRRGASAAGVDLEVLKTRSQRSYEQFMALYEQELRISQAIRKRRRVELEVRGYNYTGFVVSEKSGYASNAEWICIANFEFIALRAELISVPEMKLSFENAQEATRGGATESGLLENTPDIEAARRNSGFA